MILDPNDSTRARITYFNKDWQAGTAYDCSRSAADDDLVGSWNCVNIYSGAAFYTGTVTISENYADDFTDGTTLDSIDYCATSYVPKAYGDDTHPANFVSLFTHKAEADVGPIQYQPRAIGLWRKRAYHRSNIMDTKEKLTLYASSSQSTTMEETQLASWSTLTSHTHHAEVAVETSASYGVASGSLSALYSYEYEHDRSQTFESQVSNLANKAFSQQVKIEVPIEIPMKGPGETIETVNVWYYETTVIGQATSGLGLASATHFILSDRRTTYGCGHHIPPNCLPGYCDPDDHNCWECTTQWAQIDPTFRRPLHCEEEGEGGEFVAIQESECPHYSDIRNLPPCNESTGCGDMCEADGPMPGWPSPTHQIDNCYGAYDVFRWTCPWTQ